jgi:hypothetical protein
MIPFIIAFHGNVKYSHNSTSQFRSEEQKRHPKEQTSFVALLGIRPPGAFVVNRKMVIRFQIGQENEVTACPEGIDLWS